MDPKMPLPGVLGVVALLVVARTRRRGWLPGTTLAESVFVIACCTFAVWIATGNGWLAIFVAVVGAAARALRLVMQKRIPTRRDPA